MNIRMATIRGIHMSTQTGTSIRTTTIIRNMSRTGWHTENWKRKYRNDFCNGAARPALLDTSLT